MTASVVRVRGLSILGILLALLSLTGCSVDDRVARGQQRAVTSTRADAENVRRTFASILASAPNPQTALERMRELLAPGADANTGRDIQIMLTDSDLDAGAVIARMAIFDYAEVRGARDGQVWAELCVQMIGRKGATPAVRVVEVRCPEQLPPGAPGWAIDVVVAPSP
ncbi:MAG TPA: hypothetical protein VLL08_13270 [Kineosporiaceae bacterium]|nr:hypothetical protein [Kineosporiaceae bacterium]